MKLAHPTGKSDGSNLNDLESLIRFSLPLDCKDDFAESLMELVLLHTASAAALAVFEHMRSQMISSKTGDATWAV